MSKANDKELKNTAGRKSYDTVLMFKVLLLQFPSSLSDEAKGYQGKKVVNSMLYNNLWLIYGFLNRFRIALSQMIFLNL